MNTHKKPSDSESKRLKLHCFWLNMSEITSSFIEVGPSSEQTAASSSGDFARCLSRSLASCTRVLAQREPPRQPFPEKQHFDMEDLQSQNILLNSELSSEMCEFGIRRLVTEDSLYCPSIHKLLISVSKSAKQTHLISLYIHIAETRCSPDSVVGYKTVKPGTSMVGIKISNFTKKFAEASCLLD